MRYYKFNNDRSLYPLQKYRKSWRKTSYMVSTNRSKLLDSFFYDSQTWGALHKAWKGYVIAKNKHEYDRMEYYASVIQKLQNELGLRVSSFHNIGLSSLKFYSSKCITLLLFHSDHTIYESPQFLLYLFLLWVPK